MTLHAVGMVPSADDKLKGQAITMWKRTQESNTMHGTIEGQMVNKNGISIGIVILNNVTYSPEIQPVQSI